MNKIETVAHSIEEIELFDNQNIASAEIARVAIAAADKWDIEHQDPVEMELSATKTLIDASLEE